MFSIFEINIFKILFNIIIIIVVFNLLKKNLTTLLRRFFTNIFSLVFFFNIISIIPYRVSVTSLSSNLFLSIIIWISIFIFYIFYNTTINIRHFLPLGAPTFIISLLVLIETISVLIRPFSLRIRLISNITSRHLIIHLLSHSGFLAIFRLFFLILFEFFVCFIQSYIFYLLLNIYLDEIK